MINKDKINKESFPSIANLISTIDSRKNCKIMRGETSSQTSEGRGGGWYNTRSYQEACEFAKFGWPDVLDDLKNALRASIKSSAKYQVVKKTMPNSNIVGYVPHVPNAIQNLPNSMINTERFPQKRKTLHVIYCNGGNCGEDPEFYLRAGTTMINALNIIERTGVQVKIDLCFKPSESGDEVVCPTVTLKDYGQRFDLLKLCFPLANSSMQRRLGFKWLETCPTIQNTSWACGYGRTIEDHDKCVEILGDDSTYVLTNFWIRSHDYNVESVLQYLDFNTNK